MANLLSAREKGVHGCVRDAWRGEHRGGCGTSKSRGDFMHRRGQRQRCSAKGKKEASWESHFGGQLGGLSSYTSSGGIRSVFIPLQSPSEIARRRCHCYGARSA